MVNNGRIGFINGHVGVEHPIGNHLNLYLAAGIGITYLSESSGAAAYRGTDANTGKLVDLGESWSSFLVTGEVRQYLLSSKKKTGAPAEVQKDTPFEGFYLGFKYRLASEEFDLGGVSGRALYRSTHKAGLVLGVQKTSAKVPNVLLYASAGFGVLFNYNFSYNRFVPFLDFGVDFKLSNR